MSTPRPHPDRPLYLAAVAPLPPGADGVRRLTGVAYTGAPLDHWGERLVLDLSDIRLPTPCPVLEGHDRALRVGVATLSVRDGALLLEGRLLRNERALAIAADADDGFPWQMSVHADAGSVTGLAAGSEAVVNGRAVSGPLSIWRAVRIREVSLTPTGVDDATSAAVLSDTPALPPPPPPPPPPCNLETNLEPEMPDAVPDDPRVALLAARIDALCAERDAAVARAEVAEAALAAAGRSARLAAVQETFAALARPIDDAGAEAYLALSDGHWALVREHLLAAGRDDGVAALLAEQATDGRRPDAPRGATFEVPGEYRVDPARAALHRRAVAYAAEGKGSRINCQESQLRLAP